MTSTIKPVSEMTTKEIVAEFNQLTGKETVRFSSRAFAEEKLERARKENAEKLGADVHGFEIHHQLNCPCCGIDLHNGVGQHGDDVNGSPIKLEKHQFFCLACGGEFGPSIRRNTPSATRSRSISESWNRQEVADKRAMRHSCKVDGQLFGSVAEAFRQLNLDFTKHIAVRMEMVEKGSVEFAGKKFEHVSNE